MVFDDSVKGRIHVTDEVFESITIGVDRGVGVGAGGAPAHFQSVGETVPVRVGASRKRFSGGVVNMDVAIFPSLSISCRQGLAIRFVNIDEAVVIVVLVVES